ncbi:hypothetical protein EMIHUDRAFT_236698 [Emiliania huxleyi CCMP1516]|uniref:Uncharacterized protein n=2 Tax=Emiliania huxleyi TaxID=2903 RepID=A0A0D3JT14_EMIH1|nr:hypothetical protein EMIHUDRAFT_236698 [Emiliania huxleyi CCMP1516]EOD26649.1 hypothetical protein EMIHUDRAFT_236698 [Emiliania huxleyi CCMP1516]|eukprot:XP_005779078.1 hypothetical protein EMIHUDRAFT_236698 [Emiliania huxleyi CCMP1516]
MTLDIDGSGRFRARSSPGSAAPRRSLRPLERSRRTRGTAKEGAIRHRFFGRLPRRTTRGARARAGCGCSATSSVVPDGSGAFYHQPLPRLPPSAPSLELSEAAF